MNAGDTPSEQTLSDAIVDQIRAAIRSGAYAPGDRLVERRLAHELGSSHIPLREALGRLAEEGLVERLPRRGARVSSLTPRMLEEVSSLRVVLEQFVVRRLNGRITTEARAALQVIADRMAEAAGRRDLGRLHELDQRFHQRLWELTDHALLAEIAEQMRGRMSHVHRAALALLGPDEMRRHADSHQRLLDVIASGDRPAAERAMRQHVEEAAQRIADAQLTRAEPG